MAKKNDRGGDDPGGHWNKSLLLECLADYLEGKCSVEDLRQAHKDFAGKRYDGRKFASFMRGLEKKVKAGAEKPWSNLLRIASEHAPELVVRFEKIRSQL